MITIFLRFLPIFGEKNWRFSQKPCYDQIFSKSNSTLSKKRQYFRQIFRRKYFENHNIGPRLGEFSPIEPLFSLLSSFKNYRKSPHFWDTLSTVKAINLGKNGLCYILRFFSKNSIGHSAHENLLARTLPPGLPGPAAGACS
jgi:hypothetical protein